MSSLRYPSIGSLIYALLFLSTLAATSAPAGAADYVITTISSSPALDEFLVEQMNFAKQNGFSIPEIALRAGDHITFEGEGCVNRGGYGDTCYRWVDPLDDDAKPNNFYYGMITVRGNSALQEAQLRNIRGKEIDITRNAVVEVRYQDNEYGDNTNRITDDGPVRQCASRKPAALRVRVRHGGPPAPPIPPKDYDLVSNATDGNGLLLNPMFHLQVRAGQDAATGVPGSFVWRAEKAHYELGWFNEMPNLTNQGPRFNTDGGWCAKPETEIDGHTFNHPTHIGNYLSHVTWFPVSYISQRPFSPEPMTEHETNPNVLFGEVDFNFNILAYPPKAGTNFVIHGETDGWEPLRYRWDPTAAIDSTPFWNEIWGGSPVDPNLSREILSLRDKRAFMTGLFNVDTFHSPQSGARDQGWEVHPVFALAVSDVPVRTFHSGVTEENWHILLRDRGQGGYCDRDTKRFSFDREDQGRGPEFFAFDLPVQDITGRFVIDAVEVVTHNLSFKERSVHSFVRAEAGIVNNTTARLILFFDRSKDPNNERYFLAMGDVRLRYRWRQVAAR